jgi:hypothetical protein
VLRVAPEQLVDLGVMILHPACERDRELVGRRGQLVEQRVERDLADLELVAEAEGPFAGLAATSSGDHHGSSTRQRVTRGPGTPRCGCRP